MSRSAAYIALALTLCALVGCGRTQYVTIPGETPPPTVVTVSDTLHVFSAPDTVFLPGPERIVTRTVPVEVVRYLSPRPDTARAYLLWSLSVDSARVAVAGAQSDLSFRRPVPGETLRCIAADRDTLNCRVEGEPVASPDVRIECPVCPEPLVRRGFFGLLTLVGIGLLAAFLGFLAGRMT